MLFPFIAAIIAGLRHIVGIRGFGIFLPAVLSVVFVSTGTTAGLVLFLKSKKTKDQKNYDPEFLTQSSQFCVYFTYLVALTGEVEYSLGDGSFPCINMSGDTDISKLLECRIHNSNNFLMLFYLALSRQKKDHLVRVVFIIRG